MNKSNILKNVVCSLIFLTAICVVCLKSTFAAQYEYDKLNRVTKVTYADGSYVEYSYDANGNIKSVKKVDGTPNKDESNNNESNNNESNNNESGNNGSDEDDSNNGDTNNNNSNSNTDNSGNNTGNNSSNNTGNNSSNNTGNNSSNNSNNKPEYNKDKDNKDKDNKDKKNKDKNNKDKKNKDKNNKDKKNKDKNNKDKKNKDKNKKSGKFPSTNNSSSEEFGIVYPKTIEEYLEEDMWFYEVVVKPSPLSKFDWLKYTYTLYFVQQDGVVDDEERMEFKKVLDKFEANKFYRDYIRFKEKLYELIRDAR